LIVNKKNAYQFERGKRGDNLNNNQDKWICTNSECGKINTIDASQVEMAGKKKIMLVCGNCGYASISEKSAGKAPSWLDCIPFAGLENRLPIRKRGDNNYEDYRGRSWGRDEYTYEYKVDPEIYLNWLHRGKPTMSIEG
jgi:hypothetical protein